MTHPQQLVNSGAIPGYSRAFWHTGSLFGQATRLLLLVGACVLSFDQLLLIQPRLYLSVLGGLHAKAFFAIGVAMVGLGFWRSQRNAPTAARATAFLLGGAAFTALSGIARFVAFDYPVWTAYAADLPGLLALFAIGSSVAQVLPVLRGWLRLKGGGSVWFHPIALGTFLGALAVEVVVVARIGPIRGSLAIGGQWVASALLVAGDASSSARHLRQTQTRCILLFALLGLLALVAEKWCPLERVLASSHPLIYSTQSENSVIDVTSGQGGTHYFVDSELRFSTVDEKRWATSMTLPAAARITKLESALVLSLGEGLLERELLEFDANLRITSVVRDARLAQSSRRQAVLNAITRGSLSNPRVTLLERDPAAYALTLGRERFDLIVVDLPDPSGPRESKYYIRLFYRRLSEHLRAGGLLMVQATSARRSPRSFAIIGETLRAAGLTVTPLMIPLITRGEWSAYLCSQGPLPEVRNPAQYVKTFPGSIEAQLMHPWPDTLPPADFHAQPSTLHDAVILDWFERESGSASDG